MLVASNQLEVERIELLTPSKKAFAKLRLIWKRAHRRHARKYLETINGSLRS